jgi:crotonobetainyl-CoA:carnitine CoA-transferase CaiB-like acyl-CoA transferase
MKIIMNENQDLPLAGIKVLDMGNWIAAPASTTVMSDFGAEVIKVEPLDTGDPYRHVCGMPGMHGGEEDYQWILTNRNKRSLALDIKQASGYEALLRLVKQVDVVVTNFRPALLDKLKISYADLSPHNEGLVFAHLTGFGKKGEEINNPAFDRTSWWARSGLMEYMRPSGDSPRTSAPGLGDHSAALALFGGIMLALFQKQATGKGREVHTSLLGTGAWNHSLTLQAELSEGQIRRLDNVNDNPTPFGVPYNTADDRWFAFWMQNYEEAPALIAALVDEPVLIQQERFFTLEGMKENAGEFSKIVQDKIIQKSFGHWQQLMTELGISFIPATTIQETLADPQLIANGAFPNLNNPNGIANRTIANPIDLLGVTKIQPTLAPELGQHSVDVLKDFGFDDVEVQSLLNAGVVA